ncbi:hypothetical protein G6F46_014984 [Rhizopus delemar]|nr:hypothetical protein G6F46_014984 [Rhizopus delemar]
MVDHLDERRHAAVSLRRRNLGDDNQPIRWRTVGSVCGRSIGIRRRDDVRHRRAGLGAAAAESGAADDRRLRRDPQPLRQGGGDYRCGQQQLW